MNPEQFQKLVESRNSTRDFTSKAVPSDLLDEILQEGMNAPSWSNTRPYLVAVAEGAQRDRISDALVARLRENAEVKGLGHNPDFTHEIPYPEGLIDRSRKVGVGIYETLGIDRSDKEARFKFMERNYEFFGAPVALFFFTHRGLDHFGTLDLGLYMQTVMLSAKAHGIGTCPQGFLGNYPDIIKAEFDVPEDYALVCGMSVGYASDHPINSWRAERLPVTELKVPEKN
ncbi:MAG: nitroreductase [Microbacteriaceae bacterium]|nr:nitroreductase [Microbacteriaceae bacterium]